MHIFLPFPYTLGHALDQTTIQPLPAFTRPLAFLLTYIRNVDNITRNGATENESDSLQCIDNISLAHSSQLLREVISKP